MIDQHDIVTMLKESDFFRDFDDDLVAIVASCTKLETFEGGSYIVRTDDPAEKFYILRHGSVAVELVVPPRGRLTLQTLHDGDILGWSWLVPPHYWVFDGRAVTLVRTLTIDGKALQAKFDQNHELGYLVLKQFVKVMSARLTAARVQMIDLYAPTPGQIMEKT